MKLSTLKPVFERFNHDPDKVDSIHDFTEDQFELAFNAVKYDEMTSAQIAVAAKKLAGHKLFGRSVNVAEFLLNRMHTLVHGKVPAGLDRKKAAQLFEPSGDMNRFAYANTVDAGENLKKAKQSLTNTENK